MFNFQPGHFAPVAWQASGIPVATVLNIKEHNVDLTVLLHDVTSTGSLGVRARLAGPLDAAGTVNADFDLDLAPYNPVVSLFPGFRGIAAFGLTFTRLLQLPTIIEKLHFQAAVEKEVIYSFDVKMESRTGLVIYPAL